MMNLVLMLLVSFSFLLTSAAKADMMALEQNSSPVVAPPNILKQNSMHATQGADPYAASKSKISDSLALEVKKGHEPGARTKEAFMKISRSIANTKPRAYHSLSIPPQEQSYRNSRGLISSISPDYTVKRGILNLYKGPTDKDREALTFVFFMNPDKSQQTVVKQNDRTRLHMMWTGSKKMFTEQRIMDDEYPIDMSISQYDDGYAADEWNFVMPSKKPREVKVSLMWTF